jgi:hypothetical protein
VKFNAILWDGTTLGLCPMVDFVKGVAEPSGSVTRVTYIRMEGGTNWLVLMPKYWLVGWLVN